MLYILQKFHLRFSWIFSGNTPGSFIAIPRETPVGNLFAILEGFSIAITGEITTENTPETQANIPRELLVEIRVDTLRKNTGGILEETLEEFL